jgi:hypothetical protein
MTWVQYASVVVAVVVSLSIVFMTCWFANKGDRLYRRLEKQRMQKAKELQVILNGWGFDMVLAENGRFRRRADALYDIKVARNKQTIEEYADRVVELQKMFGIDDVVNWPQPAPHNDRWETVCSRGCGTVRFMHKSMGWRFCWYSRFYEPVGTHCPDCGWWLGLDGEGSPVVAPPGWKPPTENEGVRP